MPGADRGCVCVRRREREGVWPVSQCKQSHVSTSLMKTLSVSYTRSDSGREKSIGTIRLRKWRVEWASAVAKPGHWCVCGKALRCEISLTCKSKTFYPALVYLIHNLVPLFGCCELSLHCVLCGSVFYCSILCWAWEDGAEDEVLFSGTPGTHLTLAYCWACSSGPEHAEVWIQKCLCAAQATRGEVGGSINISSTV